MSEEQSEVSKELIEVGKKAAIMLHAPILNKIGKNIMVLKALAIIFIILSVISIAANLLIGMFVFFGLFCYTLGAWITLINVKEDLKP